MRVFGHYVLDSRVRLFVAEQAAAGVLLLAAGASAGASGARAVAAACASVLALQAALYLADLYERGEAGGTRRWSVGAGAGLVGAALVWWALGVSEPGLWFVAVTLALVVVVLLRGIALTRPARLVVYGSGAMAREAGARLSSATADCAVVGYVPDGRQEDGPAAQPLLLARDAPIDVVAAHLGADAIVVATGGPIPEEALARARATGLEVVSAAGACARFLRRVPPDLLGPSELAFGEGFTARRLDDVLQRALDLVVSGALLLAASPVLLLALLAVRIDSPGPVFYAQERVGRGGRVYRVTKVRSMRVDAEAAGAPVWASARDPRVTRVGAFLRKTRIDELPQLLAVLAGHMSLVGPRPERPYFVEQLKAQLPLFGLREAVKPGVTGWAQICYPYGATVEDARNKLEYDLYWVRHRSVFLYLAIAFHTARTVLTGRGAR